MQTLSCTLVVSHTLQSVLYAKCLPSFHSFPLLLIPNGLKITCHSLPSCPSTIQTQRCGQELVLPVSLLTPGIKGNCQDFRTSSQDTCTSITILLLPHCRSLHHSGTWERRVNMGLFPSCKQQPTSMAGNSCPLPRKREQ